MATKEEIRWVDEEILEEGLRPMQAWQAPAIKMLRAWASREAAAGYTTGIRALDDYIRLVPGEVTVVGARPGMGKTALCLQIAQGIIPDALTDSRKRVAFFSAEMTGWSLVMRMACALAGTTMWGLRNGKASGLDFDLTEAAIRRVAELPLLIDDRSSPNTEYIDRELRLLSQSYDVVALIFDFLELVSDPGNSKEQQLSNAMRNIKSLAKQYGFPAIVISHLNRECESRADKIPQLDDLRGSGMIEQLADQVVLMTRPKYYLDKGIKIDMSAYDAFAGMGGQASNLDDIAYFIIAKNRNGATGVSRAGYDGPNMRFYNIERTPLNQGA
jgi:replicative DNA helicase